MGLSCCHPLIPCQALGQAFDSSPLIGEGIYGWCCLVYPCHTPPCGYCLEASMTDPAALWIPAYAGMMVRCTWSDGAGIRIKFGMTAIPSHFRVGRRRLGCKMVGYILLSAMPEIVATNKPK